MPIIRGGRPDRGDPPNPLLPPCTLQVHELCAGRFISPALLQIQLRQRNHQRTACTFVFSCVRIPTQQKIVGQSSSITKSARSFTRTVCIAVDPGTRPFIVVCSSIAGGRCNIISIYLSLFSQEDCDFLNRSSYELAVEIPRLLYGTQVFVHQGLVLGARTRIGAQRIQALHHRVCASLVVVRMEPRLKAIFRR